MAINVVQTFQSDAITVVCVKWTLIHGMLCQYARFSIMSVRGGQRLKKLMI